MQLYKFHPQAEQRLEEKKERLSPWKLGGLTPLRLLKRVYHDFE